jgi:hypothetical protein
LVVRVPTETTYKQSITHFYPYRRACPTCRLRNSNCAGLVLYY